MQRISMRPRKGWQQTVEQQGFLFHTAGGQPYWDESACYVFAASEIDAIEKATYALYEACLEAIDRIIDDDAILRDRFSIWDWAVPLIRESWRTQEQTLIGRFDFCFDGTGVPKLYEYNADTPTSLLEASVIQWHWLADQVAAGVIPKEPEPDQFNSIHERLIEAWAGIKARTTGVWHFASLDRETALEDFVTANYLRDTAMSAGLTTAHIDINDIGHDSLTNRFVDLDDQPIDQLFKLYPWEWLFEEAFGRHIPSAKTTWLEAPWKILLSNKALLPLLWEMYPDCPYLLAAGHTADAVGDSYVKKPQFAREGANITVVEDGRVVHQTGGEYDTGLAIYQELCPLPDYEGHRPLVGSWTINGWAAGIGIREDTTGITGNQSRFVPHYFLPDGAAPQKRGFFGRLFKRS
jgi:glutathionylspermidine synthase